MFWALMKKLGGQSWAALVVIAISVLMTFLAKAQESRPGISCILEVSSREILPFEPLYVMVSLVNESNREQEVEIIPRAWVRLGIPGQDKIKWTKPFAGGLMEGPPPPPKRVRLTPNERLTLLRRIHADAPVPRRALIQKPGIVYVQGRVIGVNI